MQNVLGIVGPDMTTQVGKDRRTIPDIALPQGGFLTVRKALTQQVLVVHHGFSQRIHQTVAWADQPKRRGH